MIDVALFFVAGAIWGKDLPNYYKAFLSGACTAMGCVIMIKLFF